MATSRAKYRALLEPEYFYYAESNMPRVEPHEASEVHGDASLPYVTALLALVGSHGSPRAVAASPEYIRLFGDRAAPALAVYEHRHDHHHLPDGTVHHGHDHVEHGDA